MIGNWGGETSGSREAADIARLGGDPLHPDDRRRRHHLRPHSAAEELIAGT